MSHIFRSVLSTQLLHFFIFRNNCTFPVQHSQTVSISIDNCIFYTSLSFQVTQKELKPCINARFQPFYDLITFYTIFISKLCESALFTHLFCNFCCEVLVLLLHAFAGLETNESLNSDISTVLFRNLCYVLSYALLAILSFYINLV